MFCMGIPTEQNWLMKWGDGGGIGDVYRALLEFSKLVMVIFEDNPCMAWF